MSNQLLDEFVISPYHLLIGPVLHWLCEYVVCFIIIEDYDILVAFGGCCWKAYAYTKSFLLMFYGAALGDSEGACR
jgi:membrane protein DedA with SNARE-associated domain